jgi:hypothetical protein
MWEASQGLVYRMPSQSQEPGAYDSKLVSRVWRLYIQRGRTNNADFHTFLGAGHWVVSHQVFEIA